MLKHTILMVIIIFIIAIFGPYVGEKVTQKRMLRQQKQIVEKLQYAQKIERERLEKINSAFKEVIRKYQKEAEK